MKRPLFVTKYRENRESKSRDIEIIAEHFSAYLESYQPKSGSQESKHSRMGPVGKILSKLRSGKCGDGLKGDALRIHEMTAKPLPGTSKASISQSSFENLNLGIELITKQYFETPVALRSQLINEVDGMVFWKLEERRQDRIAAKKRRFTKFLQKKYKDIEELCGAWGQTGLSWDHIPSPNPGYLKNQQAIEDAKEFQKYEYEQKTNKKESVL